MSGDVDLGKLRKWIGKARQIGEPPTADARAPQTAGADRDGLVQFNVKVSPSVKKRLKQLAARDDIKLTTLVARMVDLYEKEYGALTDTAGKRR
jgi:predicted HicB family RNase H-like nuclease